MAGPDVSAELTIFLRRRGVQTIPRQIVLHATTYSIYGYSLVLAEYVVQSTLLSYPNYCNLLQASDRKQAPGGAIQDQTQGINYWSPSSEANLLPAASERKLAPIGTIQGHTQGINYWSPSSEANLLPAASERKLAPIGTIQGHTQGINYWSPSSEANLLPAASERKLAPIGTIQGHTQGINYWSPSSEANLLPAASERKLAPGGALLGHTQRTTTGDHQEMQSKEAATLLSAAEPQLEVCRAGWFAPDCKISGV
ncbi:hypothetical protein J6590_057568 [Homalodisca vitripennis]|nr:hypothetical protein J6590_057568 [Homalodisca vitripennis]